MNHIQITLLVDIFRVWNHMHHQLLYYYYSIYKKVIKLVQWYYFNSVDTS